MIRKLIFITLIVGFTACGDSIEPVKIEELPYVEADINGEFWEAENYFISEVKKVVDPVSGTKLLTRITVSGFTSDTRQISFTIDVANEDNYVGRYEPAYSELGGLQEITWFNKKSGAYAVYHISPLDSISNVRVRRHSNSRKLMSGTFEGILFNPMDSSSIRISNGVFSNLSYE